jgi:hypothetical protein
MVLVQPLVSSLSICDCSVQNTKYSTVEFITQVKRRGSRLLTCVLNSHLKRVMIPVGCTNTI